MNRVQLSQQSLHPHSYITNLSSISIQPNIKKSAQREHHNNSKENQSKHMNAIKPYVTNIKQRQRKISKRESQKSIPVTASNNNGISNLYPYESNSKSKNKKEMSLRKNQEPTSRNITDLYTELISIKTEYKSLKNSYNDLLKEKNNLTERGEVEAANILALTTELDKARKQEQKSRNNLKFLQQEIERIKKQCVRLVETEKFKNKKLEETIQEKQLMIAYLRSQLSVLNGDPATNNTGFFFQHTAPTYVKAPAINDLNYKMVEGSIDPCSVGQLIKNNNSSSKIRDQNTQVIYNNIDRSIINQSLMSSIPNNSILANSELVVDLPRQLGVPKKKPTINISHVEPEAEKYASFGHEISVNDDHINHKNKRQYIFSNQEDSLSFSYQKSKEDIREYDSIQSSDPTILTFTKKDVYVLDQQPQNSKYTGSFLKNKDSLMGFQQQKQKDSLPTNKHANKSHIRQGRNQAYEKKQQKIQNSQSDYSDISDPHNNQDKSSYTGQQQIMTFQNRYGKKQTHSDLIKLLNPLKQKKKINKSQNKTSQKHKTKDRTKREVQQQKRQVSSKSKLLTKRLQINTDEIGLGECKESSAETKKQLEQIKTGKKKLNRKRKSEESGILAKK